MPAAPPLCLGDGRGIEGVGYEVESPGTTGKRPRPFGGTGVAALFAALCSFNSLRVTWSVSF